MPKISFISSLLVLEKKCFQFFVLTFVLLDVINCSTHLSTNQINESFRYEWPLIGLSKQTNHTNNQFSGFYAKELPTNQSFGVIEVKSSDAFGKRRAHYSWSQYLVNSYSLVSNQKNDSKINGKYKSKAVRSVTNSELINSGSVGSAVSAGSGPSFEEEPTDSFIVRSKSAILRCKTLNALKAWFGCNTGDERTIQDKQNGHNYVDPQTGIRIIELDLEVSKNDIEEHAKAGYTTPYQCWCNAYGGHQEIVSRRASILFSFLRKHFINEPLSQTVALNSQTSFTCLPPEGDPKPTLFWLKNGELINASSGGASQPWHNSDLIPENLSVDHRNYFIGHDSSLIIKEVTLADQANYTCAVRNPAGVRYSEPAQLTVFVNGGWSSWSSWSSCNAANKCGRGSQKRIRYCSNPTPVNNGQYCSGESTQTSDCSVICSPIHGSWTSWSSWSTCSHECSQVRRRICSNPPPKYGGHHCTGHDFLIKNCTGGMCRKLDLYQLQRREREESGATDNEQQIYLMSIIITTTFLFIFIVFVFILLKRKRIKNQEWNDSDEERVGEDGQAMLLLLQQQNQQQPDLIRNGGPEKCQLISRLNDCNTNLLDHFVVRCDPLPSVPHTISSANSDLVSHNNNIMNCSQSSFNQLSASMSGTPKLKPTSAMSMATTTTTATITTSEDDNNDSEPDYAEPIIINKSPSPPPISQMTSTTPLMSRNAFNQSNTGSNEVTQMSELKQHLINIKVNKELSTTGYFSFSTQLGVGLYIPPNSIDFNTTNTRDPQLSLHYGIDLESRCPDVISLSPVVIVGNYGTIDLNRPIVVCVEHCLSLRHGKVPKGLSILWQENINSSQLKSNQKWIEVLRYGEEDLNTSCFVEINSKFIYLSTNLTGKYVFCVRKENNPKNNLKNCNHLRDETHINDTNDTKNRISSPLIRELGLTKLLNFGLSVEQFSSTEHILKVYIYDNISSSRLNFLNESPNNRLKKIGDKNTVLKIYSNAGPLCLEMLTPLDGKIKGMKRAEVPLNHLWNCGPNSLLYCSFIIINGSVVSGSHSKLNYETKVWQKSNNGNDRCYDNSILINYSDSNEDNNNNNFDKKQVRDRVIKLYGNSEIGIRLSIAAHLDSPRSDQKDWRQLANICGLDHYLPYFASQQSPTTNLLDLLEATLLNDLKQNEINENDVHCLEAKQSLNRRLIDILVQMEREEVIPLVWRQIDN